MKKLLLIGAMALCNQAFAQENLMKWVKECQKDRTVSMTVIDNKFPDTRKPDAYIVRIGLKERGPSVEKMSEAYEKDKPNAISATDEREFGILKSARCVFLQKEADKTVTETIFDFSKHKENGWLEVKMLRTFDVDNKELKKKRSSRETL